MTLSIKDHRTDDLARRLAALTGQSITEAVRDAIAQKLAEEERKRDAKTRSEELLEIGRRFVREFPKGTATSLDHDEFLYGEDGLPK